jgi:hypothetical protein
MVLEWSLPVSPLLLASCSKLIATFNNHVYGKVSYSAKTMRLPKRFRRFVHTCIGVKRVFDSIGVVARLLALLHRVREFLAIVFKCIWRNDAFCLHDGG